MVADANNLQVKEDELIETKELVGEGKRHRYTTFAKNWVGAEMDKERLRILKDKGNEFGFKSIAVRRLFKGAQDLKHHSAQFNTMLQFAKRCYKNYKDNKYVGTKITKASYRLQGGGRKCKNMPVRRALFHWFIDVRTSLKGRLPGRLFVGKAKEIWAQHTGSLNDFSCSRNWIKGWCKEFNVSLKKPNKRYKVPHEVRKRRILQVLKNVWRVRWYFLQKFDMEPMILGSDQMPLHRNESSNEKTLSFKGIDAFVKENHALSRERMTLMTTVSSSPSLPPPPFELLFKGVGSRTHVESPPNSGITFQWAEKRSYRVANVLAFIDKLPKPSLFAKVLNIFMLDDYSAHLDASVRKKTLARGYIPIFFGGGITGDVQVNDTHAHHPVKVEYRINETDWSLMNLKSTPKRFLLLLGPMLLLFVTKCNKRLP